jgi:glucose-6-phosphate isomerase
MSLGTIVKHEPFSFKVESPDYIPSEYDNHFVLTLSAMRGQYLDRRAFDEMLAQKDEVLYQVYEIKRPEIAGELLHGISILHPGQVGNEYFMTKGHFHTVLDTAEIYYCQKGRGCMVMETPEGDWSVEALYPGCVLYVPPRWAHRSVNTSPFDDLITFFIYPGNAGHDYGTIEKQGFRKMVVDEDGEPKVVNNPRWSEPKNDAE